VLQLQKLLKLNHHRQSNAPPSHICTSSVVHRCNGSRLPNSNAIQVAKAFECGNLLSARHMGPPSFKPPSTKDEIAPVTNTTAGLIIGDTGLVHTALLAEKVDKEEKIDLVRCSYEGSADCRSYSRQATMWTISLRHEVRLVKKNLG